MPFKILGFGAKPQVNDISYCPLQLSTETLVFFSVLVFLVFRANFVVISVPYPPDRSQIQAERSQIRANRSQIQAERSQIQATFHRPIEPVIHRQKSWKTSHFHRFNGLDSFKLG